MLSAHEVLLWVFALAVLLTVFLVAGRLGWCAILAVRSHNYRIAALAAAGIVCVGVLFTAVLAWWFLLAVSHGQKDIGDTYAMMAATGVPFFLISVGLWRLTTVFHSRPRSEVSGRLLPVAASATTNRSSRVKAVLLASIVFSGAAFAIAAILFLPVMLLAGPGSSMLPVPLAAMVWLAAIAAVIGIPAWLARYVYRLRRSSAGLSP